MCALHMTTGVLLQPDPIKLPTSTNIYQHLNTFTVPQVHNMLDTSSAGLGAIAESATAARFCRWKTFRNFTV